MARLPTLPMGVRLRQWLATDGSRSLILKAASGNFLVAIAGTCLAFVLNMLLARWMGAAQFGAYTYALTWMTTLAVVTTLGRSNSVVRFIPGYAAKGEYGLLRGLLRESALQVGVAGVAVAAVVAGVTVLLRDSMQEDVFHAMLLGACGLLPVLGLLALRRESLKGLKHTVRSVVPEGIVRPVGTLVLVLPFMLLGNGLTASQTMAASIGSAILALLVSSVWLSRALPGAVAQHSPRYETREWVSVSFLLLLAGLLTHLLGAVDILILGLFAPPAIVGTYAVASRMAALALFSVVAVGNILAPMIAHQFAVGDSEQLQKTVTHAAWLSSGTTVLEIIGLVVLGPWLLSFFGPDFSDAYTPMLILLGGHLVSGLCGNVGFLMTMTGYHRQALKILAVAGIVSVVGCFFMIPLWGTTGAAISASLGACVWNVAMVVYVRRHLHINPTVVGRTWERFKLAEDRSV